MSKATQSIVVRRDIAATPQELFEAWLDPASLAVWMRPGSVTHAVAKVDPTVGGAFEIVMHHATGTVKHSGVYRLIDPNRRLVFTWDVSPSHPDSVVTVDFNASEAGHTEVVITHERLPDDETAHSYSGGWGRILNALDEYALKRRRPGAGAKARR